MRKNVAAELKINEEWDKIGIAKMVCAGVDPINVLEVPELFWDRVPASDEKTSLICFLFLFLHLTEICDHPMYLRDGDLIVFRLNTEKLKVLTAEEKAKLEKERKTRYSVECSEIYNLLVLIQATGAIKKQHLKFLKTKTDKCYSVELISCSFFFTILNCISYNSLLNTSLHNL